MDRLRGEVKYALQDDPLFLRGRCVPGYQVVHPLHAFPAVCRISGPFVRRGRGATFPGRSKLGALQGRDRGGSLPPLPFQRPFRHHTLLPREAILNNADSAWGCGPIFGILPAIFRHNPYLISDYNDDSARGRLLGVGLMLHHESDKILTVHTNVL